MSRYDWMEQARCAQIDPSLWHVDDGGTNYTTARRICNTCPVQRQCADHTARLDADHAGRHGMWAGQTKKQREAKRAHAERQARHDAVVRLIERGGMDADEIATQVGCSARTVWRILADRRGQTGTAA